MRTTSAIKRANMVTPYLIYEPILGSISDELDSTFIRNQSVSTSTRYIPIKAIIKT